MAGARAAISAGAGYLIPILTGAAETLPAVKDEIQAGAWAAEQGAEGAARRVGCQDLGTWAGKGTREDGTRTAEQLSALGITLEGAQKMADFYRATEAIVRGGETPTAHIELMEQIIEVLGGGG